MAWIARNIHRIMIYGASRPPVRPLALTMAGASKAIFVALVLAHGSRFLSYQAGVAVVVDSIWVVVFALYLAHAQRPAAASSSGRATAQV